MYRLSAHQSRGFTLIEILVVLGIIGVLSAILFPVFSRAREAARTKTCASNLHQIGVALALYAEDYRGKMPVPGSTIPWDDTDDTSKQQSWMQAIFPYTKNRQIYQCPSDTDSKYSYFLSVRAAYLHGDNSAEPLSTRRIRNDSAFVLAGDTFSSGSNGFDPADADKDDYTQNLVGGPDNGSPFVEWRRHNGGQNILFADSHVKWFNKYDPGQMTFRYNEMHGWE